MDESFVPDEKNIIPDVPDGFQSYWPDKYIPLESFSTNIEGGSILICGVISFQGTMKILVIQWRQTAAGYNGMLKRGFLLSESPLLCGNEWIFQQDNSALHNANKNFSMTNNLILLNHSARIL